VTAKPRITQTTSYIRQPVIVLEADASRQKIFMPRPHAMLPRNFIGFPRPQKNCLCLASVSTSLPRSRMVDMVNG